MLKLMNFMLEMKDFHGKIDGFALNMQTRTRTCSVRFLLFSDHFGCFHPDFARILTVFDCFSPDFD